MTSPLWYSAKWQLSVIALISTSLLVEDRVKAYSYALGSVVYLIPNLYFVHYAFRYSGAQYAPLIVRAFGWGESGKIALSALGFVLLYHFVSPIDHAAVFAGFASMIIVQWWVASRIAKRYGGDQKMKE